MKPKKGRCLGGLVQAKVVPFKCFCMVKQWVLIDKSICVNYPGSQIDTAKKTMEIANGKFI